MVEMSIQEKIREACKGNDSALVVCCWDVGMPRKEPWIVKAFLPPANEMQEGYVRREQEAKDYADAMQAAFNAQRGPFSAEELALLQIAPELVARELDYFVANAKGQRE